MAGALSGGVVVGGIDVTLSGLSLSGSSAGNYSISPAVTAQPIGIITPKALSVSLIGNPTKVYDTNTNAALTPANYDLVGVVSGETITVTEALGVYDSKNAGDRTVTATLDNADYSPDIGTLLTNYTLPTSATGAGHIDQARPPWSARSPTARSMTARPPRRSTTAGPPWAVGWARTT